MAKPKPFVCIATPRALKRELRICRNSEYRVLLDKRCLTVQVDDQGHRVLHGFGINGFWLLLLHPRYYEHPFAGSRSLPQ